MTRRRARLLARGGEVAALAPRQRFRRAWRLCALSAVAPGSAQYLVGSRVVGALALSGWAAGIVGAGALLWRFRDDRAGAIALLADTDVLMAVRIGAVVAALVWAGLLVDACRLAQLTRLPRVRAAALLTVNALVLTGVLAGAGYASQVSAAGREAVEEVFTAQRTSAPLEGRFNIVLMGSDSGKGRTGIRPDAMTVVSLDAATGRTVLVSLPRNLQNVPFPRTSPMHDLYPFGYNCGSECLLNAVHTAAEARSDLYPGAADPGLEATLDAIEGATGLRINYHVIVNMRGFRDLVDAVGGVEMDIATPIAMFGSEDYLRTEYIEPGRQVLDGREALWYARSRVQSDDYARMGRQKCLLSSMLDQLSPQTVLFNATEIARSGAELLSTDLPASELGDFADLALKARETSIRTVSLTPPEFSVTAPDYDEIRAEIREAIAASEGRGLADLPRPTATAEPEPSPSATTTDDTYEDQVRANNADDLDSACG